jgi:hypothetical protein
VTTGILLACPLALSAIMLMMLRDRHDQGEERCDEG